MVTKNKKYMGLCLKLAKKGLGNVAPNPMVGSVIVADGKIIGEGYHEQYAKAHAEVNAINSVSNKKLLNKATLYVNLEPCSHFGKTPPCADLIIKHKIPRVVIGCVDTFAKVNGQGIKKLKKAGIDIKTGVLKDKCRILNKTFFTYHEKKRPYIILKWAQTADGFIDRKRTLGSGEEALKISSRKNKAAIHKLRSETQAIVVGTNTALLDNPRLTTREVKGSPRLFPGGARNPLRIVIDRNLKIPKNFNLMDKSTLTIVFTSGNHLSLQNLEFVRINFKKNIIPQILKELYKRNIQSLLVEGGAKLINSFIKNNLYDETRIFTSKKKIVDGVKAPVLKLV
jgi:diaminohydroxyphosphoribosylaminopyrimidine deaminase/5-amino-6-(5-phosphoribosylamino)uracil reductase